MMVNKPDAWVFASKASSRDENILPTQELPVMNQYYKI